MEVISRSDAAAAGLSWYFTGAPCTHGHISPRYVKTGTCTECARIRNKARYDADPEREKAAAAARRAVDPDRVKSQQAEYRAKNREALRLKTAAWRKSSRDTHLASQKKYYEANRSARISAAVSRERDRLISDPLFALKKRMRCLLREAMESKGYRKGTKTAVMLGCTWTEFAAHVERQFLPGMTWANRSEWHIDHIVPLATATAEADVLALNHFTNLRPMWGKDNLSKGSKQTHLI